MCSPFQQQEDDDVSPEAKSHNEEVVSLLPSDKQAAKVYWPCAPDGFIPNSVVRKLVKPRKPQARLIVRKMKRSEQKKEKTIEEEEEEEDYDQRVKIKGKL